MSLARHFRVGNSSLIESVVAIITPVFSLIIEAFRGQEMAFFKLGDTLGTKIPQRERIGHEFYYDYVTTLIFWHSVRGMYARRK